MLRVCPAPDKLTSLIPRERVFIVYKNIISMISLCLTLSNIHRYVYIYLLTWNKKLTRELFSWRNVGDELWLWCRLSWHTWHVTEALCDSNTSVIYSDNPWVRRSELCGGTNEGLRVCLYLAPALGISPGGSGVQVSVQGVLMPVLRSC